MTRTERIKRACMYRKKKTVAKQLGVTAPFFSYLYNCRDLDKLIARIDALVVVEKERERA